MLYRTLRLITTRHDTSRCMVHLDQNGLRALLRVIPSSVSGHKGSSPKSGQRSALAEKLKVGHLASLLTSLLLNQHLS
jgi:hypothetical protein